MTVTQNESRGDWREGLRDPHPIRCRGAFHLYSAKAMDESPRVVVVAAPDADGPGAQRCLAELARAHSLVVDPLFPEPDSQDGAQPFVVLRCSAVCDGEHLIQRLSETGRRFGYAEAIAFVRILGDGLTAAHQTIDPQTGRPLVLGSVCWSNFLFSADGEVSFIGLGHNVVAMTESGLPSGAPGIFRAPEVAAGALGNPSADLYASMGMFRSTLPFVDLPWLLRRAFEGEGPLMPLMRLADGGVLNARLGARPAIAVVMSAFRRTWRLLGVAPDIEGFRTLVTELIEPVPAPVRIELVIAKDGSWFRSPEGENTEIGKRQALRRILQLLAVAHTAGPEAVTARQLLEAGWPGEQPQHEAGKNRVYVALNTLRKVGLREVLQRFDDGYRLDPSMTVRHE